MTKRVLNGILSIVFLSVGILFVAIVFFLISSEVAPAIKQGSLNVETNSMILNHMWEGNEIYILIGAYALLACAFVYGAIRVGRKAIRR